MTGITLQSWQKLLGVGLLTVVALSGFGVATGTTPIPGPACRFFHYLRLSKHAQGTSGAVTLQERVIYSLILTQAGRNSASRGPS